MFLAQNVTNALFLCAHYIYSKKRLNYLLQETLCSIFNCLAKNIKTILVSHCLSDSLRQVTLQKDVKRGSKIKIQ